MRCTVISLLFLVGSLAAQSYDPSQDSLRYKVYHQLNIIGTSGSTRITAAVANNALNRALTQVCMEFPALEKIETVAIFSDSEGAALSDDFDRIHKVFKKLGDSARLPMTLVTVDSLEVIYPKVTDNIQKKGSLLSPNKVWTHGKRLYAHPKPRRTQADSFVVHYYAIDAEMASGTDSANILDRYLEKVILYAAGILSVTREDYAAAAFYLNLYGLGRPEPMLQPEGKR